MMANHPPIALLAILISVSSPSHLLLFVATKDVPSLRAEMAEFVKAIQEHCQQPGTITIGGRSMDSLRKKADSIAQTQKEMQRILRNLGHAREDLLEDMSGNTSLVTEFNE